MQRIAIIGSAGTGKSTLARRLGELTGLSVVHLDALYWHPGWLATPDEEWDAIVREIVSRESWITDGNYGRTMEPRLERADTVLFLDFPRVVCLWRVFKRWLRYRGRIQAGPGARLSGESLLGVRPVDMEFSDTQPAPHHPAH